MSKNARKRANKKAREAEGAADEAPAPAPAPAPAAPKAKAKAAAKVAAEPAAPQPKAEPKAKAKAKAVAEPPVVEAAPKAKAKAKGKAKAEPTPPPAPEPTPVKAAAPKAAAAKTQAKAKGKAKAAPKKDDEEEEVVKPKVEEMVNWVIDDGTGGDWAMAETVVGKKNKKRNESKQALIDAGLMTKSGKAATVQHVPGMGPVTPGQAAGTAKVGQSAAAEVARIMAMKADPTATVVNEEAPKKGGTSVFIPVPERRMALVIGKGGSTINMLKENAGVDDVRMDGEGVTLEGSKEAVGKAETAVKEIIEKGYCSLAFADFSENFVMVPKRAIPFLVGEKGATVMAIRKELKIEITFPEVPKTAADTKKFKVALGGSAAQVERAKQAINNLLMYGHDEITHPGEVHEEIEAEQWHYSFIIGPKGSELRHIQKNYSVKVSIPRETSPNDKIVIVGEPNKVERAKAHIENIMWKAENQVKGGRDKVETGDVWGDEEEEEDWMKQYMYRRH